MKTSVLLLSGILIFLSGFSLFNDPSKDILGKWSIDESHIAAATRSVIANARKSNPDLAQQMEENLPALEEMMRSMEYNFKEDHTYELQTPQGQQSGKWSFADNYTHLIFTREGKPDRKDSVLEITATRLRLINLERRDTLLFAHH